MKMLKKSIKTIYAILKISTIVFFMLFALVVCFQRFSNNDIALFNYRLFSVVTGSMQPKYNIGDVLLCKYVDPSTLREGDDVSYIGKEGSFKDKVITHRIIKIYKEDGQYMFQTQGIASLSPDPPIYPEQIYGKIVKKLVIISKIYTIVSTRGGFAVCIILPIILLVASELFSRMVDKYNATKEKHDNLENGQVINQNLQYQLQVIPTLPVETIPVEMVQYPQQMVQYPQQIMQYPQQIVQYPQQIMQYPQQIVQYPQQIVQMESADMNMYQQQSEVVSQQHVVTISEPEVTLQQESVTKSESEIVPQQQIVDISEPEVTLQQESVTKSESEIVPQQQIVAISEPEVTLQQESVTKSESEIVPQQQIVAIPEPEVSPQQREIIQQESEIVIIQAASEVVPPQQVV